MGSANAALVALFAVIAIFIPVLATGWHRLLSESVGNLEFLAWTAGIMIAFIASVLAWAVADSRESARVKAAGQPYQNRIWWAYFFVLFLLSALGTMNMAFYYGEGRIVLAESIDKATNCLNRFDVEAKLALATPRYDEKVAQIDKLRIKLETELEHIQNCGQGEHARNILAEIRTALPGFEVPSMRTGTAGCKDVGALITLYKEIIGRQLKTTKEYGDDRVDEKQRIAKELRDQLDKDSAQLREAKAKLAVGTFDKAKEAVETAFGTIGKYSLYIENMRGGTTKFSSLNCAVDLDVIRVGTISQIIPLLLGRLDRVSTYVYILIAIMADVILIACFTAVMRGNAGAGPNPGVGRPKTKPCFLWVNED